MPLTACAPRVTLPQREHGGEAGFGLPSLLRTHPTRLATGIVTRPGCGHRRRPRGPPPSHNNAARGPGVHVGRARGPIVPFECRVGRRMPRRGRPRATAAGCRPARRTAAGAGGGRVARRAAAAQAAPVAGDLPARRWWRSAAVLQVGSAGTRCSGRTQSAHAGAARLGSAHIRGLRDHRSRRARHMDPASAARGVCPAARGRGDGLTRSCL